MEDFYAVGLQVFRISEEQVVAHMMNIFVEAEEGKTKYEQLLADINALQNTDLEFPTNVEQSHMVVLSLYQLLL